MHSTFTPTQATPISDAALSLLLADCAVRAGFPSMAAELGAKRIDLTAVLVTHPQATYLWRVAGDSMEAAGIYDGDLAVVNRALEARHGNIVVAGVDYDYTIKFLEQRGSGRIRLVAANPTYPPIVPRSEQTVDLWGVVTASIKRFKV